MYFIWCWKTDDQHVVQSWSECTMGYFVSGNNSYDIMLCYYIIIIIIIIIIILCIIVYYVLFDEPLYPNF